MHEKIIPKDHNRSTDPCPGWKRAEVLCPVVSKYAIPEYHKKWGTFWIPYHSGIHWHPRRWLRRFSCKTWQYPASLLDFESFSGFELALLFVTSKVTKKLHKWGLRIGDETLIFLLKFNETFNARLGVLWKHRTLLYWYLTVTNIAFATLVEISKISF